MIHHHHVIQHRRVESYLTSSHHHSIHNIDDDHHHHHRRGVPKFPPALTTKALRRGKAPLSHESQPFRLSILSALAECPGGEGEEAPVGPMGPTWRRR